MANNSDLPTENQSEQISAKDYNKVIRSVQLRLVIMKLLSTVIILFALYQPFFFLFNEVARIITIAFNTYFLFEFQIFFLIFLVIFLSLIYFTVFSRQNNFPQTLLFFLLISLVFTETEIFMGLLKFNLALFIFKMPSLIKRYEFYFSNNVITGHKLFYIDTILSLREIMDRQIREYISLFVISFGGSCLLLGLFSLVKLEIGRNTIFFPFILISIFLVWLFYSPRYLHSLAVKNIEKNSYSESLK